MIGLWLQDQQLQLRDDLEEPEPASGEALVRLLRAGICTTDIELNRGYAEFTGIPGHELVGEVEQGPTELIGKRVVSEINLACGECTVCRTYRPAGGQPARRTGQDLHRCSYFC
jgi:threonine dehydrogenase-like Zn-dependent dehydrogenase